MAHNGGLMGVNLDYTDPYQQFWAIDALRMAYPWDARLGTTIVNENWPLQLNTDDLPQAMPGGTADRWYKPAVYIYGNIGDTWDLIWPSAKCTAVLNDRAGITLTSAAITGGTRYTIASAVTYIPTGAACFLCSVEITAMSAPILNNDFKLYRTEHATRVANGEIFNPLWLAVLDDPVEGGTKGFGLIRWMTGQNTNSSYERTNTSRKKLTNSSWIHTNLDNQSWSGTCTKVLNAFTTSTRIPSLPAAWTDGQIIQFRLNNVPTVLTSNNITRGATTTIVFTGNHGMATGDKLSFGNTFNGYPTGWTAAVEEKQAVTGIAPSFAVTVVNPTTVTVALDSSTFGALATAYFAPEFTLTDGTLPAKKCFRTLNVINLDSATLAVNDVFIGVYNSKFDCIVYQTENTLNLGREGFPVEVLVALANKTSSHMQCTFPVMANLTYRQEVMTYVRDNLNTGLIPYFEVDNEPWNSSFGVWRYNRGVGAKQSGGVADQRYGHGEKVMDMKSDAATIFASTRTYKLAFNFQNVSGDYTGWLQGNPAIHAGNTALYPGNNIDIFQVAPYYLTKFNYVGNAAAYTGYQGTLSRWLAGDTNNKNTAFEWFAQEFKSGPAEPANTTNEQIDDHIGTFLPAHITGVASYTGRLGTGLEVGCYEAGPHTIGPTRIAGGFPVNGITAQNVNDFYFDYMESEWQAYVTSFYYESILNLGYKLPCHFTLTAWWQYYNMWGAQRANSYPAPVTPQWKSLVRINAGYKKMQITTS